MALWDLDQYARTGRWTRAALPSTCNACGAPAVAISPDATFAALADPTRRAILARLSAGDATVNELAEPFDLSLPGISKHLKVLERSGLITRRREASRRVSPATVSAVMRPPRWRSSAT